MCNGTRPTNSFSICDIWIMDLTLLTLGVATLPVLLVLYYFWHKDTGEKEPPALMRAVFFWGLFAILPVALIELALQMSVALVSPNPSIVVGIVSPFLFIALPEEFAKFLVVKKVAFDHHKFNEIMDGITYCVLASMGFALLENVLYTFQYGVSTGILRAFTAVPAHALFSGIMGYYIGCAKFKKDPKMVQNLLRKGIIAGVVFHGLYDFLLMSGVLVLILLVFPLMMFMWTKLSKAVKLAHANQEATLDYF